MKSKASLGWVLLAVTLALRFADGTTGHAATSSLRLRHVATFVTFMGSFETRQGAVYLHELIEKETREDPAWYKKQHPSWNGEPFRAAKWAWNKEAKSFMFAGESFYTTVRQDLFDTLAHADADDSLSIRVTGEPWAGLVPRSVRVKAVARADLDGDKQKEVVVLWADPKREEPGGYVYVPKTLVVLKQMPDGWRTIAQVDHVADDSVFSRMTVEDVTADGLPEVLIWGFGPGGSGWSAVLEVYGKDMGQRYVKGW